MGWTWETDQDKQKVEYYDGVDSHLKKYAKQVLLGYDLEMEQRHEV
jgi:hypothetical protein